MSSIRTRIETMKQQMRRDYKLTFEAYLDAKKRKDNKLMIRLSEDLIRIADAIERQK